MNEMNDTQDTVKSSSPVSYLEFLTSVPPLQSRWVTEFWERAKSGYIALGKPTITIHCSSEDCGGDRFFDCQDTTGGLYRTDRPNCIITLYSCRHCGQAHKTFALLTEQIVEPALAKIIKLGEWPPFGPPTPPRLIAIIGQDRETFLMGKRAESHGLGLGAFTYYRRVVENQKIRLIDTIIKVGSKVGCPKEMIAVLENAKTQPQFSKAVELIKDAIPQVLLINGHNPLTLLHSALSRGIHAETDEECLELAATIRLVLGDMAERMAQALKDQAELHAALSKLMNPKKRK